MSFDLLAEFDSFYKSSQQTSANSKVNQSSLEQLKENNQPGLGGDSMQWPPLSSNVQQNIWGGIDRFQNGSAVQQTALAQENIWGSFESAAADVQAPVVESIVPEAEFRRTSIKGHQQRNVDQSSPGIIRRPTLDIFSGNLDDNSSPKNVSKPKAERIPPHQRAFAGSSQGEVLFDAADELAEDTEDDDEFGDFETVQDTSQPLSQTLDLFGDLTIDTAPKSRPSNLVSPLHTSSLPYPQAPKSPSFQERNPFSDLGVTTNHISTLKKEKNPVSASPTTAWPAFESDDPKPVPYVDSPAVNQSFDQEWGDFGDLPSEATAGDSAKDESDVDDEEAWSWDGGWAMGGATHPRDRPTTRSPSVTTGAPPPTNIPPPSALLGLFGQLFDLPQSTLFKPLENQSFSLKTRILSDPSTISFLRSYLLLATTAAHILAGRKLRWKRDMHLSQAMKIGPAAAGGKGGMKLAGLDKAEITKEDREASDIVRIWKEQLGRLRSSVATANSCIQDASQHLTIPEINEIMSVKTQYGALTAPKPCIICGLKRDERINKVDNQVEDSFGEWWIEHWGHRACRNFWLEYEKKLKHR